VVVDLLELEARGGLPAPRRLWASPDPGYEDGRASLIYFMSACDGDRAAVAGLYPTHIDRWDQVHTRVLLLEWPSPRQASSE
jgi:hypothetical protein